MTRINKYLSLMTMALMAVSTHSWAAAAGAGAAADDGWKEKSFSMGDVRQLLADIGPGELNIGAATGEMASVRWKIFGGADTSVNVELGGDGILKLTGSNSGGGVTIIGGGISIDSFGNTFIGGPGVVTVGRMIVNGQVITPGVYGSGIMVGGGVSRGTVDWQVLIPAAILAEIKGYATKINLAGLSGTVNVEQTTSNIEANAPLAKLSVDGSTSKLKLKGCSGAVDMKVTRTTLDIDSPVSKLEVDGSTSTLTLRNCLGAVDMRVTGTALDIDSPISKLKVDGSTSKLKLRGCSGVVNMQVTGTTLDIDSPVSKLEVDGSRSELTLRNCPGAVDMRVTGTTFDIDSPVSDLKVDGSSSRGTIKGLTNGGRISVTSGSLDFIWPFIPRVVQTLNLDDTSLAVNILVPEGTIVNYDAFETYHGRKSNELPSGPNPHLKVRGSSTSGSLTVKKLIGAAAAAPAAVATDPAPAAPRQTLTRTWTDTPGDTAVASSESATVASGQVPPASSAAPAAAAVPSAREILLDLRRREEEAAETPSSRAAAAAQFKQDLMASGRTSDWEARGRQAQERLERQRATTATATETATAAAAGAGAAAPSRSRSESDALQAALAESAAAAAAQEEDERLMALALAASLDVPTAAAESGATDASGDARLPGMDLVDALHASLTAAGILPLAAPVAPSAPPADTETRSISANAGAGVATSDGEWFVVNTYPVGSVSKFVATGGGTLSIEAAPGDVAQIKAKRGTRPGPGVKCESLGGALTITNSDASDTGGYVVMLPAGIPVSIKGDGTVNLKGLRGVVDIEGKDLVLNVDGPLQKLSVQADSVEGTIQNLAGGATVDVKVNKLKFAWDTKPLAMRTLTFMGDTLNAIVEAPDGTTVSYGGLEIDMETEARSSELPVNAHPDINIVGDCASGTLTVKKRVGIAAAAGAGVEAARPRSGTDEAIAEAIAASLRDK